MVFARLKALQIAPAKDVLRDVAIPTPTRQVAGYNDDGDRLWGQNAMPDHLSELRVKRLP